MILWHRGFVTKLLSSFVTRTMLAGLGVIEDALNKCHGS